MIDAVIEMIAKNPPSIAIAIAGVLALTGQISLAIVFLIVGVFLQTLWLIKG